MKHIKRITIESILRELAQELYKNGCDDKIIIAINRTIATINSGELITEEQDNNKRKQ